MSVEALTVRVQSEPHIIGRGDMARFCLLRMAALPYAMLDALRLPQTERRVQQILAAEDDMEFLRPSLEDALYVLVPSLEATDARLRRAVLKLRRDVHNDRPTTVEEADIDAVAVLLDPPTAAQLRQWKQIQRDLAQAKMALEPGMRAEVQERLRPNLRAPLKVPSFRRALAFASAGVARGAAREKKLPTSPHPSNLERSLLGYLGRAAAKTSPFSSFMAMSVVDVQPDADLPVPRARDAHYISRTRLNRGIFSRLQNASVAIAAHSGDIELKLNPTLMQSVAGRVQALCNTETVLLGRPWLEQRLAWFRLDPRIVQVLLAAPETDKHAEWCRRLTLVGLTMAQADDVVGKLTERGVLLPPPLIDAFDETPERTLARSWAASASPLLRQMAPSLEQMAGLAHGVAQIEGDARVQAFEGIRESETSLLGTLQEGTIEPLQNMVLEDCWLSGLEGGIGVGLAEPLQDLQKFLATQVIVSPFHDRLRGHFLSKFGAGGECRDAVGFLTEVADKLVDLPELGARPADAPVTSAPEGTTVSVTAQVQIASGPALARPMVVVNRVFDGAGWLAARFAVGDQGDQGVLRDRLRQWLRHVTYPREPVDVVLSGRCNDLQAHPLLTDRVLQWPGEPVLAGAARTIDAQTVRLVHNATTGLLELFDRDGVPIQLTYLGSTFPSPIWGVRYALSVLAQPFVLRRPDFRPPESRSTDVIAFEGRHTKGNLVLRRATWWLSKSYLKRHWFASIGAQQLLQIKRDCERHGIPDVVFAQRYIAPDSRGLLPVNLLSASRKPLWVDLRNPFWLNMLERMAEEGEWIFLTEPFPAADGLWLDIDGERHVSEMQLEMIVRADPPSLSGKGVSEHQRLPEGT
ncbi:MAG: hypothetical protein ABI767_04195 [Rhodanobacter sp.]